MDFRPVSVRSMWPHEERDFSKWLWDNIHLLSEVVGFKLVPVKREVNIGGFQLDLLAVDERGEKVAIECQLGRSDHDHLGKLITYSTNIGARTGVWIAAEIAPAHVAAIKHLNESSAVLRVIPVQVTVMQSPDGELSPVLLLADGKEQPRKGKSTQAMNSHDGWKYKFWAGVLEKAIARGLTLHENVSPREKNALCTASGFRGIQYRYLIREGNKVGVEIYIRYGGDASATRAQFRSLEKYSDEIDQSFGEHLKWEPEATPAISRVRKLFEDYTITESGDNWDRAFSDMTDAMERLRKATVPYLRKVATPT